MTVRALFAAAVMSAVTCGFAVGAAPVSQAEPVGTNCTELSASGSCEYRNCTAAHNDGRYNITQDDPAYCPKQDRDNDGIACEG